MSTLEELVDALITAGHEFEIAQQMIETKAANRRLMEIRTAILAYDRADDAVMTVYEAVAILRSWNFRPYKPFVGQELWDLHTEWEELFTDLLDPVARIVPPEDDDNVPTTERNPAEVGE